MKHWYYADEARQPQGPVDAATLRELLTDGQISHATLIWRDGLSQWQAAADFADELELGIATRSTSLSPESPEDPALASPGPSDVPPSPSSFDGAGTVATNAEVPPTQEASPYSAPHATIEMAPRAVQGGEIVYAGFWKRVAAYIIDTFVMTIINTVVGMVVGMAMVGLLMSNGGATLDSPVWWALQGLSYLAQIVIMAVYFAWFHASSHQATPGKMAIGIKVVDRHGATISFWRGIGRFFATFVSTLLLLAGYLMAAFTRRKQALHDLICGTLVVDKWAYTHHPERQRPELGTVTWVVLILGGLLALLGVLAMGALIAALGGGFGE
nr:RDD family protein [Pseudoxanthomonas sp.]